VLPSLEEGFGMPVLEAMSLGIPVVASDRGALPDLLGDAGILIDPTNEAELADACGRVLLEDRLAQHLSMRGRSRAANFSWRHTAAAVRQAFVEAAGVATGAVSKSDAR
jgi:glycosyltransferase involved in cell wall biosynthesis